MQSSIASGLRRKAAAGLFAGLAAILAASPFPALSQAAPGASATGAPAGSDPRAADAAYDEARRLLDQGRSADALAAAETALKASPSDARLRFLKGVILTRGGRETEAIDVFRGLTQDFPELPEPHNNLAALHASRGELEQARAALDAAIRALPSYALARENLGDVYLRLAMREWAQAAKLDPSNAAASAKLKQAMQLSERTAPTSGATNPPAVAGPR